jgi:hypothetical protein
VERVASPSRGAARVEARAERGEQKVAPQARRQAVEELPQVPPVKLGLAGRLVSVARVQRCVGISKKAQSLKASKPGVARRLPLASCWWTTRVPSAVASIHSTRRIWLAALSILSNTCCPRTLVQ